MENKLIYGTIGQGMSFGLKEKIAKDILGDTTNAIVLDPKSDEKDKTAKCTK